MKRLNRLFAQQSKNINRLSGRRMRLESMEPRMMRTGFVGPIQQVPNLPVEQAPPTQPSGPVAEGSITYDQTNGKVIIEGTDTHDDTVTINLVRATSGNPATDHLEITLANINNPQHKSIALPPGTTINQIVFHGYGGNDTIDNRSNIPLWVDGGKGNDVILGGSAADTLMGGDDNDYIDGRGGDDMIWGLGGVDALFGDDGSDMILGGDQVDYIFGGNGDDYLYGEAGNDRIYGEAGNDYITGNDGTNTIYADYGPDNSISCSGFVAFDWFDKNMADPALRSLARQEFRDGVLDRQDMLSMFTLTSQTIGYNKSSSDNTVSTNEFNDLKNLLSPRVNFQVDTRYFTNKVVNGDVANAHYQGAALGNLAANGSGDQLNKLVDKWFKGGDLPATGDSSITYKQVSGSLFMNGVSLSDIDQGSSDDCYFLAALGEAASHDSQKILNMFAANGDGTYTVTFYHNGSPEYVTVNSMLPVDSSGRAKFAGWGYIVSGSSVAGKQFNDPTNELWVALAEKAYAQINESNWINQDGTNTYAGIGVGSAHDAIQQITGESSTWHAGFDFNALVNAVNQHQAIEFNTKSSGVESDVTPFHFYMLVGYDPTTKQFEVANPHNATGAGSQTPILYWTIDQLNLNCTGWEGAMLY